ncbi:hypothetical protein Vretifemale_609 [Volvox reticuliferus]|nr:hypothetical protein Vretifemale_609 [Volvox reticuliferus]
MRGAGELPQIMKLVAVFPFFETNFGGSWRQRQLRALAPWYEYLGWVGAAVTSLPRSLRQAFVGLNAGMDSNAVVLTSRLLSRHTVRNAFYLASHEFNDLSKPWDWALLAAFGRRLHVMGCEADTWLSRCQYDDMLTQVPGLQATWHPELRHAFCTSERQSAAVAAAVGAVVQSIPDLDLDLGMNLLTDSEEVVDLAGDLDLLFPSEPMSRANSSKTPTSSVGVTGAGTGSETTGSETPTAIDETTTRTLETHPFLHHLQQFHETAKEDQQQQRSLPRHVHNPLNDNHQHHNHPPHDDQMVPFGQTSQQRRELYGDDVVAGSHHTAIAAWGLSQAGGSSADADGDVDEVADQSADARATLYGN